MLNVFRCVYNPYGGQYQSNLPIYNSIAREIIKSEKELNVPKKKKKPNQVKRPDFRYFYHYFLLLDYSTITSNSNILAVLQFSGIFARP